MYCSQCGAHLPNGGDCHACGPQTKLVVTPRGCAFLYIGVSAIVYGLLLCLYYLQFGPPELMFERTRWAAEQWLAFLAFAVTPVFLVATGVALCTWRTDRPQRIRATLALLTVTIVLLVAKAILSFLMAMATLNGTPGFLIPNEITAFFILVLVSLPSSVWVFLLGSAASVCWRTSSQPGTGG